MVVWLEDSPTTNALPPTFKPFLFFEVVYDTPPFLGTCVFVIYLEPRSAALNFKLYILSQCVEIIFASNVALAKNFLDNV